MPKILSTKFNNPTRIPLKPKATTPRQVAAQYKIINPPPNFGEVITKGVSTLASLVQRAFK